MGTWSLNFFKSSSTFQCLFLLQYNQCFEIPIRDCSISCNNSWALGHWISQRAAIQFNVLNMSLLFLQYNQCFQIQIWYCLISSNNSWALGHWISSRAAVNFNLCCYYSTINACKYKFEIVRFQAIILGHLVTKSLKEQQYNLMCSTCLCCSYSTTNAFKYKFDIV